MRKPNLLFVVGTRPEVIKTAPIILACKESAAFNVYVLSTSQHRELQDDVLNFFEISVTHDLNLMQERSDLTHLVSESWRGISSYLQTNSIDMLFVQGDTTTAFTAALGAVYQQIPVAHIEAGLRTYVFYNPFPEEINRRLISHVSSMHFAPTKTAKENLLREHIGNEHLYVVGNSGIDALLYTLKHISNSQRRAILSKLQLKEKVILVTSHRRENWGDNLRNICQALKILAREYDNLSILFLVHPNPAVSQCVNEELSGIQDINLIKAVPYPEMAVLLEISTLILTDSGGIQEEAPALGKPVLVLREKTERPEGIAQNSSILVGTSVEKITNTTNAMLINETLYQSYAQPRSPYGDGKAAERICQAILYYFGWGNRPVEFIS